MLVSHVKAVQDAILESHKKSLHRTLEQAKDAAQSFAPVATGSLAAAFYTVDEEGSTYHQAVSAAKGLNPKVEILDEVAPPAPGEGKLSNAAAHSVPLEFGTIHGSAQPSMGPGSEVAGQIFVQNQLTDMGQAIEHA